MQRRSPLHLGLALAVLAAAAPGLAQPPAAPAPVNFPEPDVGLRSLEAMQRLQLGTAARLGVFHGFGFRDLQPESGIDFVHESVDDSLVNWIPVHYDHGNGIAVADVDGDGLLDVYLSTQLGSNRLYKNLGGGRFADVTATAGVGLADRISVAASFADIDNDGDPDLFVTTVRMGNALFRNDGGGRFTDVTRQAGLDYSGHSSGAVFFDYDLDGRLDLFVTNVGVYTTNERGRGGFFRGIDNAFQGHIYPERAEASRLYRNLGDGRFEDVTAATGNPAATSWSGDATFTDLDGDRYPELYVLDMQGDDLYYVNRGGKTFVEAGAEHFPRTSWGAMGVKFFDYDNNGRLDLYVTDMHSDMHSEEVDPLRDEKRKFNLPLAGGENNIQGNSFYAGQEDGSFLEVSDLVGAENFWPWGFSVGDLNADGYEDVFVAASMNYPFRYAVNKVMLNLEGRIFADAEFLLGVEPRRDGRARKPYFTLDCDGDGREHRMCEGRAGSIVVSGALGSRASAIFDLDGDGDLDIVTNEFNDVPQVLVSDAAARRKLAWIALRLVGTSSNRDGLGALVTVRTGGRELTRFHDGKSGYLSQSSLPLYFGLGAADRIDAIEVCWPSGIVQTVTPPIAIGTVLELREPEPAAPGDDAAPTPEE